MTDSQRWQRPIWRRIRARRSARILAGAVATTALALLAACFAAAPALADPSCAKFAAEPSKGGSDGNTGDEAHPYATLGKLASSLSAGQTGCVFSGQTIDVHQPQSLRNETHGTEGAPITITSTNPAEPATVTSSLAVEEGSDWIDFTHLKFWWSQPPPYACWNAEGNSTDKACNGEPQNPEDSVQIAIDASHTAWLYDDIQNFNTDICMNIGSYAGSTAHETLIEHDRIHNCGLPFRGEKPVDEESAWHDHAVYDFGVGTKILNNYIYSNSRNGILFYGGGSGGVAEHNVIDENGNGITFGDTVDSTARWNIITNNSLDDTGDCAPRGCDDFGVAVNGAAGDRFEHNCLDNNLSGEIEFAKVEPATLLGVIIGGNLLETDPLYENAGGHDYTLSPGSPCLGYGPDTAQPTGPPPAGPPPGNGSVAGRPSGVLSGESPAFAAQSLSGGLLLTTASLGGEAWNTELLGGGAWSTSAAPSAVAGPSGGVWVAFEGPANSLWVSVEHPAGNGPSTSYQGLAGTTYSAPSIAIDSAGNVWVAAEGPSRELIVTERAADTGRWTRSAVTQPETMYSAPSAAVDSAGKVWIAFQGEEHSLLVVTDWLGGWGTVPIGGQDTTYSEPATAVDSAGDVWVATEGPSNQLHMVERFASGRGWRRAPLVGAAQIYSAPAAVADSAGNLWIAFQGPGHSLWLATDRGELDAVGIDYESPERTIYSAPSEVLGASGELWVGYQRADNDLGVLERPLAGTPQESDAGG